MKKFPAYKTEAPLLFTVSSETNLVPVLTSYVWKILSNVIPMLLKMESTFQVSRGQPFSHEFEAIFLAIQSTKNCSTHSRKTFK